MEYHRSMGSLKPANPRAPSVYATLLLRGSALAMATIMATIAAMTLRMPVSGTSGRKQ